MKLEHQDHTLIKGGIVVTMDPKLPNLSIGDVLIEGDRIAAVGANLSSTGAASIDASGCIVMPGLIDAHHHMWLGVMRRLLPNVDDLFAYIEVVAERLGAHYRPLDMYLSTKLTAAASLDAGITTIIDACHSSRSPEHTDAALDALQHSGIRALHMVGAAMDKSASSTHLPADLKRLAQTWNKGDGLIRVGLFGQLNLDWWKVARSLGMNILTEFLGDLSKLGPQFAEPGVLGPHNIFNHCTRVPPETWKMFADAGVNITVNPRSDALFGFDDESFAYQQAIDHGLTPALGIDLDTAFGSDLFGEMHALFGQQRSAMRYRRLRGETRVPAPISVEAVLEAATINGARAAGLESSIGTLTPGKQADLILIRTDDVAVFPVTKAIATIVQAVERSNVDTVIVRGEVRKRGGKLVGIDVTKLQAEVNAARDRLFAVSGYRTDLFSTAAAKSAA